MPVRNVRSELNLQAEHGFVRILLRITSHYINEISLNTFQQMAQQMLVEGTVRNLCSNTLL